MKIKLWFMENAWQSAWHIQKTGEASQRSENWRPELKAK